MQARISKRNDTSITVTLEAPRSRDEALAQREALSVTVPTMLPGWSVRVCPPFGCLASGHYSAPERCYLERGEAAVLRRNVKDALRTAGFEVIAGSKPLPGQVR